MSLLDQFGRPATYMGGYSSTGAQLYESSQDSAYRLARPWLDSDIQRLMSRQKHRMLLSDSRWIACMPLVQGAVQQKADYVCAAGWLPTFTGQDQKYGDTVTPLLHAALRIVDARGPLFDFNRDMHIGCTSLDIDGDWYVHPGETESGFPQVQFLEAHRIGTRAGEREVKTGPYSGLPILNGVIYNRAGRPVAYRFLGDLPEQDQDISAREIFAVAQPRWFTDGRPFPSLAYSILDWYDVKETRGYEKIAQKANAAIAMVESTETGKRPAGLEGTVQNQSPVSGSTTPTTYMLEGGLIRYVKAGSGDIKVHAGMRPVDGQLKFDDKIVAGAFYGMGWRFEMFNPSALSGAPTRGFQDQINTTIYSRWEALVPAAKRIVFHVVSKLAARKDIPFHAEWDQWAFDPPPEFTVDANKDSQTYRDNIRSGLANVPSVHRRMGTGNAYRSLREQAAWLKARNQTAVEFGVDPRELGDFSKPGDSLSTAGAQQSMSANNPQDSDKD